MALYYKELNTLMIDINKVFKKYKKTIWLECGTLLGIIRDNNFISWEKDLDFGTFLKNYSKNDIINIIEGLKECGYNIYKYDTHLHIRYDEIYYADINFYTIENDYGVVKLYQPNTLKQKMLYLFWEVLSFPNLHKIKISCKLAINYINFIVFLKMFIPSEIKEYFRRTIQMYMKNTYSDVSWYVPLKYIKDQKEILYTNNSYKIPLRSEEYLEYRYGKDWKTPRKNWVTEKDDKTILKKPNSK